MSFPTWKYRVGAPLPPLIARLLAVCVGLIPCQSTAQPTPKRLAQPLCGLLPDLVPQFHVPPTSTFTVPLTTVIDPSALVFTAPPMMPVPCESGRGLAALAKPVPTVAAMT